MTHQPPSPAAAHAYAHSFATDSSTNCAPSCTPDVVGSGARLLGDEGDPADFTLVDSPEPVAVLVDVVDQRRGVDLGDHFSLRSSSAAAKDADAVRKISFARRSSRFSGTNSAMRRASAVVTPGRWPSSISTWKTRLRNVSELIPS